MRRRLGRLEDALADHRVHGGGRVSIPADRILGDLAGNAPASERHVAQVRRDLGAELRQREAERIAPQGFVRHGMARDELGPVPHGHVAGHAESGIREIGSIDGDGNRLHGHLPVSISQDTSRPARH